MKNLTAITVALAALSFAGLVMAEDAAPSKTRAQVVAELSQARASGELAALQSEVGLGLGNAVVTRVDASAMTRADVLAELSRARATGELQALYAEGGPVEFTRPAGRTADATLLAGQSRKSK